MTNHIMLRLQALVRLIPVLVFSFLSAIGLAQMTKPVTKSEPQEKTAPAQTQQIGGARSGYVSEADVDSVPSSYLWMGETRDDTFSPLFTPQADSESGAVTLPDGSIMCCRIEHGLSEEMPNEPDPYSQPGTWYQLDQSTFPDAPSATQKVEDAPASYDYWDYTQPQMTFRKTATDPMFYGPFLGLLAANAIDIEATRASGCGEAHDFGRKPARLSQYGQDYAADFAIGTMAFFLHRSHFRLIPQGMLGYGIAIHIRGAVRGFQANCH